MTNFLEARKIVKKFSNHTALNEVDISVEEGKIFGLLGPNGAGKTTLIRIINNITAPDTGEIFFNGEKLKSEHSSQIGYLPEERGLYKKMNIGEQSLYFAQLKGMNKADAEKKLKKWFEKFEIQNWWNKKVEELSKGMQQKVQFITTILHEPKLLIFDEPFSGFDPINTMLLKNEILELKRNGSTIIFSTHNMSSVEEICDNIALINKSEKIIEGELQQIKNQYKLNIFDITYSTLDKEIEKNENFEISQNKDKNSFRIKCFEQQNTNELIAFFMKFGQISSFNEVIPNINDIFIKLVSEN